MNSTYTLWRLLGESRIEIPLIQRDYAQGRQGEKNAFIRKNIIADIRKALEGGNAQPMDFVYGEFREFNDNKGNEDNEDNKDVKRVFYPLDGQQRLTTLWLVHWYIFINSFSNWNVERKEEFIHLSRFSYKTRSSSADFCQCLCKEDNITDIKRYMKENSSISIATAIKTRTWFFKDWLNDLTIDSMLRTLSGNDDSVSEDCIEVIFNNVDFDEFRKKLKEKQIITFELLDLCEKDSFVDGDDIYIKMNARGKPLTDFENLKSDLVSWMTDEKNPERSEYEQKYNEEQSDKNNESEDAKDDNRIDYSLYFSLRFDNEWTDVFWNEVKDSKEKIFDPIIFSFINRYALNVLLLKKLDSNSTEKYMEISTFTQDGVISDERRDFDKLYGTKLDGKNANDSKISYEEFKYYKGYLSFSNLVQIDRILATYGENSGLIKDVWGRINKSYSFIPVTEFDERERRFRSKRTELQERVYFFATCRYILENDCREEPKEEWVVKFKRWMRVVHNLVRNYYFDQVDDLINCLRLINDLADKIGKMDVYKYLNNDVLEDSQYRIQYTEDLKKEERFKLQLLEEAEKAARILACPTDEDNIIQAEEYSFFDGTIRFLYRDENNKPVCWDVFADRFRNAKTYFSENEIEPETLQVFLSLFKRFDDAPLMGNYLFSGKGYSDRYRCWKKDILCNENLYEKLGELFKTEREELINRVVDSSEDKEKYLEYKAQCDEAYFAFISDADLLKDVMKNEKGKYTITKINKADDLYRLKAKDSSNNYDNYYLGKDRLDLCKRLREIGAELLNTKPKDKNNYERKYHCRGYGSLYIRGTEIKFLLDNKKHILKVAGGKQTIDGKDVDEWLKQQEIDG